MNNYDHEYSTCYPNLWIVWGNGGLLCGVYDKLADAVIVPLVYNNILVAKFDYLWHVYKGSKWGVYNSNIGGLIVPLDYDMVKETSFYNLWFVYKDYFVDGVYEGECGIYNGDTGNFIVPMGYERIFKTSSPNLWRVANNKKWGLYNSNVDAFGVLPVFSLVDGGEDLIFQITVGFKCFDFNMRQRQWVDCAAVIAHGEKDCKDMLRYIYLYTTTPEKALQPH